MTTSRAMASLLLGGSGFVGRHVVACSSSAASASSCRRAAASAPSTCSCCRRSTSCRPTCAIRRSSRSSSRGCDAVDQPGRHPAKPAGRALRRRLPPRACRTAARRSPSACEHLHVPRLRAHERAERRAPKGPAITCAPKATARTGCSPQAGGSASPYSALRWCSAPKTASSTCSPLLQRLAAGGLPRLARRRNSSRSTSRTWRAPSSRALDDPMRPRQRATTCAGRRSTRCANWSSTPGRASGHRAADHRPRRRVLHAAGMGDGVAAGQAHEPRQRAVDVGGQRQRRAVPVRHPARRRSRRWRRSTCGDSTRARATACSATTPAERRAKSERSRSSSPSPTRTTRPGRCGPGCCCAQAGIAFEEIQLKFDDAGAVAGIEPLLAHAPGAGIDRRRRAGVGFARHRARRSPSCFRTSSCGRRDARARAGSRARSAPKCTPASAACAAPCR